MELAMSIEKILVIMMLVPKTDLNLSVKMLKIRLALKTLVIKMAMKLEITWENLLMLLVLRMALM
jgi:hypothetical protein